MEYKRAKEERKKKTIASTARTTASHQRKKNYIKIVSYQKHLYNVLEMGLSAIHMIPYFFDLPFQSK